MRSKRKAIFLIALAILPLLAMSSCNNKETLIDDTRTFAGAVWNRFTPEVFELQVTNDEAYYNIDFEVVVDSALMRGDNLPLTVNMYSPNGERRMFYAYIHLRENGRWKGETVPGKDGLRKRKETIRPFFSFNDTGTYRIEIVQGTSQYDLEGIESFRLDIERTEIDYKGLK